MLVCVRVCVCVCVLLGTFDREAIPMDEGSFHPPDARRSEEEEEEEID